MNTIKKRVKTLLSKKEQEKYLDLNWENSVLYFKWGRSGSHKCTLYNKREEKLGSAGGGGYDKKGVAFAQFIMTYFTKELKKLNSKEFYGLTHYNPKTHKNQLKSSKNTNTRLDGACGFNCMVKVLNKIGFQLEFIKEGKWEIIYKLNPLPKNHHSRTKYIYN